MRPVPASAGAPSGARTVTWAIPSARTPPVAARLADRPNRRPAAQAQRRCPAAAVAGLTTRASGTRSPSRCRPVPPNVERTAACPRLGAHVREPTSPAARGSRLVDRRSRAVVHDPQPDVARVGGEAHGHRGARGVADDVVERELRDPECRALHVPRWSCGRRRRGTDAGPRRRGSRPGRQTGPRCARRATRARRGGPSPRARSSAGRGAAPRPRPRPSGGPRRAARRCRRPRPRRAPGGGTAGPRRGGPRRAGRAPTRPPRRARPRPGTSSSTNTRSTENAAAAVGPRPPRRRAAGARPARTRARGRGRARSS